LRKKFRLTTLLTSARLKWGGVPWCSRSLHGCGARTLRKFLKLTLTQRGIKRPSADRSLHVLRFQIIHHNYMGNRQLNRLTAKATANMTVAGLYCDGGGLYLQVTPSRSRTWIYRFRSPATAIPATRVSAR